MNTKFYPGKKTKNCRVGDLILLYWYNYIDLKVIKSSDIPVISRVVYDLGFCPKHAWIMWGRWGYGLTAGRVATVPPWAPPASHSAHLQDIQVAFGHANRTGSTLGAGHKVSLGFLLPVGCTILVGYPVSPSCPERCTRGRTPKVLPAMNICMDNCKAPNTFVTTQTLPGLGWAVQTRCVQPEALLPCSVTGSGGCPPLAMGPGLGWGCKARDPPDLTFPTFNVCPLSMASCVPANAFIPLLWHKPCFYTEGNTASWFCTLTFSNSDSNARQNF